MSVKKIFYSTVVQSAGKIVSAILGIITIALMSRHLGRAGFGEYTTIVTFMGFFGVLADLGLSLVMTKKISQALADEKIIVGNIFAFRFMSALSILAIGVAISFFLPYSKVVKEGMLLSICAFSFISGTQVLGGLFQKHLVIYPIVISEIIQRLVMLTLVVVFIWLDYDLLLFILALSISSVIHFGLLSLFAHRLVPFRPKFDLRFWKEVLNESWPLALSSVLSLTYFRGDILVLSVYKTAADVGIYGIPRKIIEVLLVFPAIFSGLIMPFLARFAFSNWRNYRLYLQKSLDAIYLIIVPMVITVIFFARPIVDTVGGTDFRNADSVLRIMIISTAFIYINLLLGNVVVALGEQKAMLKGNLIGCLCGLGLYFWLIPRFSYFGAAASTAVVHIIICLYAYRVTSRKTDFAPSFRVLFKALIASIPTIVFLKLVTIEWVAELLTGLAIYSLMLVLLQAVPREFIIEVFGRGNDSHYAQEPEL